MTNKFYLIRCAAMLFDTHLFVGVDPCGGRKPFTYAAVDKNGRLVSLQEGEIDDVLAFLGGLQSALVGINAPPRPNQGLVRQENIRQNLLPLRTSGRSLEMRLAEHLLRERGINVAMTPSKRELCTNWAQLGFEFYRRIEALGYYPGPAENMEHLWIETQPHATFCGITKLNIHNQPYN